MREPCVRRREARLTEAGPYHVQRLLVGSAVYRRHQGTTITGRIPTSARLASS